MKTSDIFAACIPLIEGGDEDFICHALCQVITGNVNKNWVSFQDGDDPAMMLIMNRLGGVGTLLELVLDIRDVIHDIFHQGEGYLRWSPSEEEVRKFRILWLNSLVAEFQQLGD